MNGLHCGSCKRACPLRDTAVNGLHCGSCKRACPLRDTAVNGLHCGSCKRACPLTDTAVNGLHCGSCNKCITFNNCPIHTCRQFTLWPTTCRGVEQYCHVTSSLSCAIIQCYTLVLGKGTTMQSHCLSVV